MPQISLDWDTFKAAYPMRPLKGPLAAMMDSLPDGSTPCCVQMSHALNVAGCLVGTMSNRRHTSRVATPDGTFNYLLAVDEMKWFLGRFGAGEEVSGAVSGKRRASAGQMREALNGRTGIIVFSNLHLGTHTEIWDVDHMHQTDMSPALFNAPQVLFWDVMVTATA